MTELFTAAGSLDADVRTYVERTDAVAQPDGPLIGATDRQAAVLRVVGASASSATERMRLWLVSATHKDARITAFLSTWAFEQYWLGRALSILAATPDDPALDRRREQRASGRGAVLQAVGAGFAGTEAVPADLAEAWLEAAVATALLDTLATPDTERLAAVLRVHERYFALELGERLRGVGRSSTLRRLRRWRWPEDVPGVSKHDAAEVVAAAHPRLDDLAARFGTLLDAPIRITPHPTGRRLRVAW